MTNYVYAVYAQNWDEELQFCDLDIRFLGIFAHWEDALRCALSFTPLNIEDDEEWMRINELQQYGKYVYDGVLPKTKEEFYQITHGCEAYFNVEDSSEWQYDSGVCWVRITKEKIQ